MTGLHPRHRGAGPWTNLGWPFRRIAEVFIRVIAEQGLGHAARDEFVKAVRSSSASSRGRALDC